MRHTYAKMGREKGVRRVSSMTAQEAIHELLKIRNYCAPDAIPAIEYAIRALQEEIEREKPAKA